MATNLNKAVGTFSTALPGTTVQTITVGFQPAVVIFFVPSEDTGASGGSTTFPTFGVGFSNGTDQRFSSWSGSGSSQSKTQVGTTTSDVACCVLESAGALYATGTMAITSTGFTMTWVPNSGNSVTTGIQYIALGGNDIGNVAIGTKAMPITAIANSVTGLTFRPNFVMLISGSRTANTGPALSNANFSYGAAISTSKRFAHALCVQNAQTSSTGVNAVSRQNSDKVLQGIKASTAAIEFAADFTSFNADGFTITFSTAPASAYQYYYLAIGGTNLKWDIGTNAKPTTGVAQTITGETFQPELGIWELGFLTALNTITSTAGLCVGAASTTADASALTAWHNDAIPTVAGGGVTSPPTVLSDKTATASFTSFNSGGWTITWGASSAAEQISWIMLAGTTAPIVNDIVMVRQAVKRSNYF